ncbi:hypothetical protein DL93DRAFT_2082787 [Clavulina sp. PMI_390]|nr:hypothetical protein DL93DRAFT_2082787 [Clavulina sp. PMI_390]
MVQEFLKRSGNATLHIKIFAEDFDNSENMDIWQNLSPSLSRVQNLQLHGAGLELLYLILPFNYPMPNLEIISITRNVYNEVAIPPLFCDNESYVPKLREVYFRNVTLQQLHHPRRLEFRTTSYAFLIYWARLHPWLTESFAQITHLSLHANIVHNVRLPVITFPNLVFLSTSTDILHQCIYAPRLQHFTWEDSMVYADDLEVSFSFAPAVRRISLANTSINCCVYSPPKSSLQAVEQLDLLMCPDIVAILAMLTMKPSFFPVLRHVAIIRPPIDASAASPKAWYDKIFALLEARPSLSIECDSETLQPEVYSSTNPAIMEEYQVRFRTARDAQAQIREIMDGSGDSSQSGGKREDSTV